MRITSSVTLAVTTATLLLSLAAPAMATNEQAGQCAGDGTDIQTREQGSSERVDIDGTMVTVTISDQTVTFTGSDGQPIDVTFCVKASDENSGTQTGSSWTVTLENGGDQAPAISHVVIYGLAGTAERDGELSFDAGLAGECVDDDATFTVSGVAHYDDADGVTLEQLYRDDFRVDQTTLDGSGVATVSDVLAAGEQADYLLHIDGDEVAAATFVNTCTAPVPADPKPGSDSDDSTVGADGHTPGAAVLPEGDDDADAGADGSTAVAPGAEDDTEVLAGTDEAGDGADGGAARLAATGSPVLILVLMGLATLLAGTGVLTAARRR